MRKLKMVGVTSIFAMAIALAGVFFMSPVSVDATGGG